MENTRVKIANRIQDLNVIESKILSILDEIEPRLAPLKEMRDEINDEIDGMIKDLGDTMLQNKPYGCGTANFCAGDYEIKYVAPKKVTWDEKKLLEVEEMIKSAGKNPNEYIHYKLSVAEKDYALFDDNIKTVFKPARTVGVGKPRITFKRRDND